MKIHIVQKDETLWKIAQKYGVALDEVIEANPQISNPDLIMPGMKIKVPTVAGSKQQSAHTDKKDQVQPAPENKKDKQEVKPEMPSQMMPVIEEDDDKKWEPLKKEMPSLPIHFNKQPQQHAQPTPTPAPSPSPSQDLKWTQLTNNFETHIHKSPAQPEEEYVEGVEQPAQPEQPSYHQPQPLPYPMPHPQPEAPCYSKDGIPYGTGPVAQHYQMPEGAKSHKQTPSHGVWYQAQQPSTYTHQQEMPYGPNSMPQTQWPPYQPQPMPYQGNQMMPQQQMMPNPMNGNQMMPQQQMMPDPMNGNQMMPQQQMMPDPMNGNQMMPQQQMMPDPTSGNQMMPQQGVPNYPMPQEMPQNMYGMSQMPYQPYPQQPMPYNHKKKKDCGCNN
ncbi:SafA/ExsA family spore coat assembly protein [Gracilibacillus sp. S3-1-1]|uniref:SafA/ExsA family spore coat assembly protein n=1 Tax=Gracilibacillus pellucidus TaxID=3095368 RepID=A0ACC6M6G8_9BACI|nr:SafA/ExsA family spore coat assembly protein [Gracilibacillus sp. S3-1-1]MDX8046544.1 SafA/ExsA family spore coat assembly protein [Gracilibacillus sp. S3-1-1]